MHKTARNYARELRALHTATLALLSTLDLETLLGKILDAATSAIPRAEKGMVYLIARDTGQLEMRAVLGYAKTDPRIQKLSQHGSMGHIAKVVSERMPISIKQIEQEMEVHSLIAAPLILEGHVLGALSLEASKPRAFSAGDLRLLVNFAATATAAISNAQLHAEVQRLAITDALTELYNRRGLFELGEREVERTIRFDRSLTAILLDVDNLKPINDTYGHAAGDQVLCFIAEQCRAHTRKVDILSRLGGDEFALLLTETDLPEANQVAERLCNQIIQTPLWIENQLVMVSVSIGVAQATPDVKDLAVLLQRADTALYAAKQAGRSRVEVW
jgi:diguanylate cyclase (GGDEF)-like protein